MTGRDWWSDTARVQHMARTMATIETCAATKCWRTMQVTATKCWPDDSVRTFRDERLSEVWATVDGVSTAQWIFWCMFTDSGKCVVTSCNRILPCFVLLKGEPPVNFAFCVHMSHCYDVLVTVPWKYTRQAIARTPAVCHTHSVRPYGSSNCTTWTSAHWKIRFTKSIDNVPKAPPLVAEHCRSSVEWRHHDSCSRAGVERGSKNSRLLRKQGSSCTSGHQERESSSLRTAGTGADGSTETAGQSDSERDHHCAAHKRGWCQSHRVNTSTYAGDETNPRNSSALPADDGPQESAPKTGRACGCGHLVFKVFYPMNRKSTSPSWCEHWCSHLSSSCDPRYHVAGVQPVDPSRQCFRTSNMCINHQRE